MFWLWFFIVFWIETLALATLIFLDNPPALLRRVLSVVIFPFYPLAYLLASGIRFRGITILRGNLFFTFIAEGTEKILIRGEQFERKLFNLRGYKLGSNGFLVPLAPGERDRWRPWGGLRFYGFWPIFDILVHKFAGWTNVLQDGTLRKHEDEWMDSFSLKEDTYYACLERVEDSDMLPLKVEILLTLRIADAYRAYYGVQDWLETVINRFWPVVRDLIAQGRYEELNAQRTSLGGTLFSGTATLRQSFYDRYGVETVAVEMRDIDPPADWRERTLSRYGAERAAEALLVQAEAEAEAIKRTAEAEAEAIRARQSAVRGVKGMILRFFDKRFGG